MTKICWWLVDLLFRMLEPGERDVVRGDFTESGETAGQALRDLFGLVYTKASSAVEGLAPLADFGRTDSPARHAALDRFQGYCRRERDLRLALRE